MCTPQEYLNVNHCLLPRDPWHPPPWEMTMTFPFRLTQNYPLKKTRGCNVLNANSGFQNGICEGSKAILYSQQYTPLRGHSRNSPYIMLQFQPGPLQPPSPSYHRFASDRSLSLKDVWTERAESDHVLRIWGLNKRNWRRVHWLFVCADCGSVGQGLGDVQLDTWCTALQRGFRRQWAMLEEKKEKRKRRKESNKGPLWALSVCQSGTHMLTRVSGRDSIG